jgi:NCS1 family nucleobase:cation symporter-1
MSEALLGKVSLSAQFRSGQEGQYLQSSEVQAIVKDSNKLSFWSYLLWFTSMVGFWATMSISISDITRQAKSQKDQIAGQFIGLPGTMVFYSFTGIFVTCAAVLAFPDILVAEDAPWDPVSLINRFDNPGVIIFAQIAMLIATLSTNIAANVIAPANAISNVFPKQISFRVGGVIAGLIGIVLCPWWLMNDISSLLIFISGLLGPVLAVLLCDYFLIRKTELDISSLYRSQGAYTYTKGYNLIALFSIVAGAIFAVIGKWVPQLVWIFNLSWFSGFIFTFILYYLLMKFFNPKQS